MDIQEMLAIDDRLIDFSICDNGIAKELIKLCEKLGENLQPICFCDEEEGKVDIATMVLPSGKALYEEVIDFYEVVLGRSLDRDNIYLVSGLVLDYFMRLGLVYIEEIKDSYYGEGKYSTISKKFLSTKNEVILTVLLNSCREEDYKLYVNSVFNRYGANLDIDIDSMSIGQMPYVRVEYEKEHKAVRCNKMLDFTCIRFTSLPLTLAWLRGMKRVMEKELVKITYKKDDGQDRLIYSTFNMDILKKFYSEDFAGKMLQGSEVYYSNGINIESPMSGKLERGYIQIPEVGCSTVDDRGFRAMNFARVCSVSKADESEIDTTFLNVSLGEVIEEFTRQINIIAQKGNFPALKKVYVDFQRQGYSDVLVKLPMEFENVNQVAKALREFVERKKYAGTVFQRDLHKYMVSNPDLFDNYTGEKLVLKKVTNYGVDMMDF